MEVKLDKRYPLEASVDQAWAVLRDVKAVAGCMPGAARRGLKSCSTGMRKRVFGMR